MYQVWNEADARICVGGQQPGGRRGRAAEVNPVRSAVGCVLPGTVRVIDGRHRNTAERGSIDLKDYPAVKRWYDEIAARPAVQRGLAVLSEHQRDVQISDAEREITFGATQFAVR